MSDKIIDLNKYRVQQLEEELLFEIQQLEDLGVDMRHKYVIFDTSDFAQQEFTKDDVIASLSFCMTVLLSMGEDMASCEIENIVTRLKNNYYDGEK